jgi:hypothetical protein
MHHSLSSHHYYQVLVAVLLFFVLSAGHVFAADPQAAPSEAADPSGLTSCFDYYTFGSVSASFTPSLSSVSAGAPIVFTGTVTNENPYPIVNAAVWVKIFRQRDTSGAKDPNGPDVVDMLQAASPITLKAGESREISFTWNVPQGAQDGSYQAASYVVASDRFNMSGLSFTDDVTGSLVNFSVVGGQAGSVGFDKTSVTVNGIPFFFAAFPPRMQGAGDVSVKGSVANTTDMPTRGTITWQLYSWDALKPDALIDQQTQEVKIHPHSTTDVSYVAKDTAHAVYYLVGTLTVGTAKSIIGVRFVRSGIDSPRINFAGVTQYPLTPSSKLFMCAHNTNDGAADDSQMTVSIVPTNPVERIVASLLGRTPTLSYAGSIPSQIVALSETVKAMPTSFDVVTRLYQGGILIDEVTVPYSCADLGAPCGMSYTIMAGIAGGVLVFILLILAFVLRGPRPSDTASINTTQ